MAHFFARLKMKSNLSPLTSEIFAVSMISSVLRKDIPDKRNACAAVYGQRFYIDYFYWLGYNLRVKFIAPE